MNPLKIKQNKYRKARRPHSDSRASFTMKKNSLSPVDVIIPSPIGNLGFYFMEERLIAIQFLPQTKARNPALKTKLKPILADLNAYFKNPQHRFKQNLPLSGTPF